MNYLPLTLLFICFFLSGGMQTHGQLVPGKTTRIYNQTELGYGVGVGNYFLQSINAHSSYTGYFYRFRTQFGYLLSERLAAGMGFGLDGYHNFTANTAPVFCDIQYYFYTSPSVRISIWGNAGYSVRLAGNFENGSMLGCGIGTLLTSGKMAFVPRIGFQAQQINDYGYFFFPPVPGPVQEQQDKIWLKTIVFNLGILL
jgi:hypothetical protein